uniref:Uncharacterized protein n=1 Tax=Arundo donax TaxID=35708 RepID=A0A0A9AFW5_ARUDO
MIAYVRNTRTRRQS